MSDPGYLSDQPDPEQVAIDREFEAIHAAQDLYYARELLSRYPEEALWPDERYESIPRCTSRQTRNGKECGWPLTAGLCPAHEFDV